MFHHLQFDLLEEFKAWLVAILVTTKQDVTLMLEPLPSSPSMWKAEGDTKLTMFVCLGCRLGPVSGQVEVPLNAVDDLYSWADEKGYKLYRGRAHWILPGDQ